MDTRAVIIGAGVAGCAVTRALVVAGYDCVLYDQCDAPANGTSAVPCALIRPQVTKNRQPTTAYFDQAFDNIHRELKSAVARGTDVITEFAGALQLISDVRQWPANPHYTGLTKAQASVLADVALAGDALYFDKAGWVDLRSLCHYWLKQCSAGGNRFVFTGATRVESLVKTQSGWQLLGEAQQVIDESPLVIIASGEVACRLPQTSHLPLQKSRGQLSYFAIKPDQAEHIPKTIITGKGSVIPVSHGVWVGSTHDRESTSTRATTSDDRINLQTAFNLCPQLKQACKEKPVSSVKSQHCTDSSGAGADRSWTGVRYSTPDRLPIIGAAPDQQWYQTHYADLHHGRRQQQFPPARFHDGLYLATGFGSRGVLHSVYASDTLAAMISGKQQPSATHEKRISQLLHPGRFIVRQLRRGR